MWLAARSELSGIRWLWSGDEYWNSSRFAPFGPQRSSLTVWITARGWTSSRFFIRDRVADRPERQRGRAARHLLEPALGGGDVGHRHAEVVDAEHSRKAAGPRLRADVLRVP